MKNKGKLKEAPLRRKISSKITEDATGAIELLKDIENLTVEDVVVMYAYAEAIVETVREPLVILDGNLRVKTANISFFEAFKVSKKETYNKYIFELGNGQWKIPGLEKLLKNVLQKNSQFNGYEVTHKFESIGTRVMLLNARRIVLEGHKTELILLAIEDITERKLIDKQKDDFIAIASHELKTPLTSIKTYVDILLSYNAKTEDKKNIFILGKVEAQIDRMEHMMGSFLNVYTLQTGKLELRKSKFLLDEVIVGILKTFEYTTESHTISYQGKSTKKVFADKERLGQVLTNLLTNAIKYSPNSDKVIIKIGDSKEGVVVSVQDFGVGIPEEEQKLIFERFFRAKGKMERKVQGLGLGLYIAHEIVKEHKGKMWVKSQEDKGTTFYFSLPAQISTR